MQNSKFRIDFSLRPEVFFVVIGARKNGIELILKYSLSGGWTWQCEIKQRYNYSMNTLTFRWSRLEKIRKVLIYTPYQKPKNPVMKAMHEKNRYSELHWCCKEVSTNIWDKPAAREEYTRKQMYQYFKKHLISCSVVKGW